MVCCMFVRARAVAARHISCSGSPLLFGPLLCVRVAARWCMCDGCVGAIARPARQMRLSDPARLSSMPSEARMIPGVASEHGLRKYRSYAGMHMYSSGAVLVYSTALRLCVQVCLGVVVPEMCGALATTTVNHCVFCFCIWWLGMLVYGMPVRCEC